MGGNDLNRYYILLMGLILFLLVGCQDEVVKEASDIPSKATAERVGEFEEPKGETPKAITKELKEEKPIEPLESCEFIIDIGDDKHKFIVTMKAKPFEEGHEDILFDSELVISIYDINDLTTPVQELVNQTERNSFLTNEILDANFDGYSDFGYVAFRGARNAYSNYFLWDNDEMRFVFSERLSELSLPSFDSDLEIVSEFNKSGSESFTCYYRFYDDNLICVRALYMDNSEEEGIQILRVEDYRQGELVEVFSKKASLENSEDALIGEVFDEFFLWENLNYSGE